MIRNNIKLHPGDTHTATGALELLKISFAKLPSSAKRIAQFIIKVTIAMRKERTKPLSALSPSGDLRSLCSSFCNCLCFSAYFEHLGVVREDPSRFLVNFNSHIWADPAAHRATRAF